MNILYIAWIKMYNSHSWLCWILTVTTNIWPKDNYYACFLLGNVVRSVLNSCIKYCPCHCEKEKHLGQSNINDWDWNGGRRPVCCARIYKHYLQSVQELLPVLIVLRIKLKPTMMWIMHHGNSLNIMCSLNVLIQYLENRLLRY